MSWGPRLPCKQALRKSKFANSKFRALKHQISRFETKNFTFTNLYLRVSKLKFSSNHETACPIRTTAANSNKQISKRDGRV